MSRRRSIPGACLASLALAAVGLPGAWGQGGKPETKAGVQGGLPAAAAGDQVIVKREATQVEPPHKYKIPLFLEPIRSTTLVAPFDGIVRQADIKPNTRAVAQAELMRLDSTVARLQLQRAEASLKVAMAEQRLADKDELKKAVAQGHVDVARADVDLAKYMVEQASIRAPFAGEVQRVLVTEGEFVRAGDPLAVVVDTTRLRVEIPVERSSAAAGKTLPIKVESAEVEAKVEAVLPLSERFGTLRDLFESVASAAVVVDNADGKLQAGQTVYVPLIPRQPVAEVPSSAIGNLADGQRKVQVVRHMVVRDIPVVVMGAVGVNRLFVSGAFAEGDEVIYESSHQLADAFQLKPAAAAAPAAGAATPSQPSTPASKPAVGF